MYHYFSYVIFIKYLLIIALRMQQKCKILKQNALNKSIFKISPKYSSLMWLFVRTNPISIIHFFYWINNKMIFKCEVTDFPIG